jgi:hypothetical protein
MKSLNSSTAKGEKTVPTRAKKHDNTLVCVCVCVFFFFFTGPISRSKLKWRAEVLSIFIYVEKDGAASVEQLQKQHKKE